MSDIKALGHWQAVLSGKLCSGYLCTPWLAAALLQLVALSNRHHSSYVFLHMSLLTGTLVMLDHPPPVSETSSNLILSSKTRIYFQR